MARRTLGMLVALMALLAGATTPQTAQATPQRAGAEIELSAQSPLAERGSDFVVRVRLTGIPEDGSITLSLHQRVRSRSELEASNQGEGLRSRVIDTVTPLATLPVQSDGTRRLVLSLDPSVGGVPLSTAGVYPLQAIAKDAADNELATLVTHLIVPPEVGDTSPPLSVAVVARLGAPPALQLDGSTSIGRAALGDAAGLVGALRAVEDVTASLAVTPETIEALETSGDPDDTDLVGGLRAAAADRTVIDRPYANVSPDAMVEADLREELTRHLNRGREVLTRALGQAPTPTTWLADPDLGELGLDALPDLGVRHVVVSPTQVAPLPDGLLELSLAHRFLLAPPDDGDGLDPEPSATEAIALDPVVVGRLAGEGSPALVASRVLTELAVIWFEQPGVARGAALPVGTDTDPATVRAILEGLRAGKVFSAVSLDQLFAATSPLVDPGDNAVARALTPETGSTIATEEAEEVRRTRAALDTFGGMVGADSPRTDPLERELLLATATEIPKALRTAHARSVVGAIDTVAHGVSGPERFTLTLTARDGTIPLTLRNDSGIPLHVVVRLRSAKLDFPEGTEIERTLTEPSTRLDIPVTARASGAFPLTIEVTSPDGQRRLVMSRYTVRSTAVAGAGLVLSIGAGLFLVVWWARHWRRTRRSARLVASTAHPTAAPTADTSAGQ